MVDPIDGTVNYAYGIPAYAVSIGVVEGPPDPATWTAVAGVVNNPATGELSVRHVVKAPTSVHSDSRSATNRMHPARSSQPG